MLCRWTCCIVAPSCSRQTPSCGSLSILELISAFRFVEERVRSYERDDELSPDIVPFLSDANWQPFWMIVTQRREGLYGTIEDALCDAKRLLADGS
jgi:hypothetical protein